MGDTKIEWTDAVWNPVRGCTRVSEGCQHCYAERRAARFSGPGLPFEGFAQNTPAGPRWTGKVALIPAKLNEPLTWRKPCRVFVNSMSDLFHEGLTDDEIAQVFAVMSVAKQHAFQVLTKRPHRMAQLMASESFVFRMDDFRGGPAGDFVWPLPNVWLGVSVEDQATADARIPHLLATPAAVRFVSAEPLLGPVDLWGPRYPLPGGGRGSAFAWGSGVSWVIVGGESGPGARPMHPGWARSLRNDCQGADMPFFFKQWGEWAPDCLCSRPKPCRTTPRPEPGLPGCMFRCGKRAAGRLLDGRTWDQMPARSAEAEA